MYSPVIHGLGIEIVDAQLTNILVQRESLGPIGHCPGEPAVTWWFQPFSTYQSELGKMEALQSNLF